MSDLGSLVGKPLRLTLEGNPDPRRCYAFVWATACEDLEDDFEDMFCDGYPEGFSGGEDEPWTPFAIVGLESAVDPHGQHEGVLFLDADGKVVHLPVDGTALVDRVSVIADSLDSLAIESA